MNKDAAFGLFFLALLLGGAVLLARRSTSVSSHAIVPRGHQLQSSNIRVVPVADEPKRYRNKETRRVEYNADGLPILIEIIRDCTVT